MGPALHHNGLLACPRCDQGREGGGEEDEDEEEEDGDDDDATPRYSTPGIGEAAMVYVDLHENLHRGQDGDSNPDHQHHQAQHRQLQNTEMERTCTQANGMVLLDDDNDSHSDGHDDVRLAPNIAESSKHLHSGHNKPNLERRGMR